MGCGTSAPYTWIEYVNTHSNISDYESRRCPWDTIEREILQSFQTGNEPAPFKRADGGCLTTQTGPGNTSSARPTYTVGDDGSRLYRQYVPRKREACLPSRLVKGEPGSEHMSDHVPLASLRIPQRPSAQVTARQEESNWYDQHNLPIPKYVQAPERFVDAFQSHAALLHAARGGTGVCPTPQKWMPQSCPLSIPSRLAPVRRVRVKKEGGPPPHEPGSPSPTPPQVRGKTNERSG